MLNKKGVAFSQIMAVIGAVLISVGIAWLLAQNWHNIPSPFKILILLGLTFAVYVGGIILQEKEYPKTAHALLVLGALLYTLSIFLIAQIFSTSSNLQNYAWLFLLAWVGVTLSAYLFGSYVSLFIALIEFLVWLGIQFIALINDGSGFSWILFALLFLVAGILFYGLSLFHRSYQHRFARLFQWWTAFYFLVFTYILTFQLIIPQIWRGEVTLSSPTVFLIAFGAVSLLTLLGGILLFKDNFSLKEVLIVIGIIILLISLLLFTKFSSDVTGTCYSKQCYELVNQKECDGTPKKLDCLWDAENDLCLKGKSCLVFESVSECNSQTGCEWNTYYTKNKLQEKCLPRETEINPSECEKYSNKKKECTSYETCKWIPGRSGYGGFSGKRTTEMPGILLFTWIVINIFFILLILVVIGYGSQENFPALINLGILLFAVDILSRYIGFVMDLWGYNILPFIFITGGIILIGGGWLIERWRRSLINEARGMP